MKDAVNLVRELAQFPLAQLFALAIVCGFFGLIYLRVMKVEKSKPADDGNRVATTLDISELRREMQGAISERTGELWKRVDEHAEQLGEHGERLATIEGRDDRPPLRRRRRIKS